MRHNGYEYHCNLCGPNVVQCYSSACSAFISVKCGLYECNAVSVSKRNDNKLLKIFALSYNQPVVELFFTENNF